MEVRGGILLRLNSNIFTYYKALNIPSTQNQNPDLPLPFSHTPASGTHVSHPSPRHSPNYLPIAPQLPRPHLHYAPPHQATPLNLLNISILHSHRKRNPNRSNTSSNTSQHKFLRILHCIGFRRDWQDKRLAKGPKVERLWRG